MGLVSLTNSPNTTVQLRPFRFTSMVRLTYPNLTCDLAYWSWQTTSSVEYWKSLVTGDEGPYQPNEQVSKFFLKENTFQQTYGNFLTYFMGGSILCLPLLLSYKTRLGYILRQYWLLVVPWENYLYLWQHWLICDGYAIELFILPTSPNLT